MSSPPNDRTPATSDSDAVRAVALDYIEGWYSGDATRMARSLHDDLVKRTPFAADGSATDRSAVDGLRTVPKARMVELTLDGGGRDVADPSIEVVVDAVSDHIACARTTCADFVDYLHLFRTPDGWKIANILFRSIG